MRRHCLRGRETGNVGYLGSQVKKAFLEGGDDKLYLSPCFTDRVSEFSDEKVMCSRFSKKGPGLSSS